MTIGVQNMVLFSGEVHIASYYEEKLMKVEFDERYNIFRGRVWIAVLVVTVLAPRWAYIAKEQR